MEKLRELEDSGEMSRSNNSIKAVMAKLTEIESLLEAFEGCRGVFHTSAFTDPAGLSGYTVSSFPSPFTSGFIAPSLLLAYFSNCVPFICISYNKI